MNIYGYIFRYFGWLIGLLLIFGKITFYNDGSSNGLMVLAGVAILAWWGFSTWRTLNQE